MRGRKVSLVDAHDFEDGYKGKSLVTNTKHLDEDDNISETQEEENDDITHKKMRGRKVSLVDAHDFEDGYKGKSLVTNTKHLAQDDNISETQEEENDDVTHGAMQIVVERNKTGREMKKTDDSNVNIS